MSGFHNAVLVLPHGLRHGGLSLANGLIATLEPQTDGFDCEGGYLLPGLIDLHTDNLERQASPRVNALWPSAQALLAHDKQCLSAGITTVFDALCIGEIGFEKSRHQTFLNGVADLTRFKALGALQAEHFLHLRCELPSPGMPAHLAAIIANPLVRLVSVMDHTPGIGGQYADIPRYRAMRQAEGFAPPEIDAMIEALQAAHHAHHRPNRADVLALARAHGLPVASHDDRASADIAANTRDGIALAEFPVTREAAAAARAAGQGVIGGAPNIVRGGSHAGNVAVQELVQAGLIDALASDYVPAALLEAAFMAAESGALALPQAVALITAGPARLANLPDRGALTPGLRADLILVRLYDGLPVVRGVWRAGVRVG
ncbi:alpha-D-ribose 1-methylphosphonate 5-triphosphate diphosphatase [Acidocella sp.]|uniref:alpha-D-ribose 1-methylphosphonate 5-triphosphate diphosphatase n=1 Tax=Acidocella sp. TaxID=50710 RepID=UPI002603FBD7|nr:alpha-D-ribose 1-methylphosphonate 5-triphosphate diphosphatase [Acidocella sp.]